MKATAVDIALVRINALCRLYWTSVPQRVRDRYWRVYLWTVCWLALSDVRGSLACCQQE